MHKKMISCKRYDLDKNSHKNNVQLENQIRLLNLIRTF